MSFTFIPRSQPSAKPFHLLSLMDSIHSVPYVDYSLSANLCQQLNINVGDPNNNYLTDQKFKTDYLNANCLLLSTDVGRHNSTSTSVIVKHESAKNRITLCSKDLSSIHRPIPTDQENFFANNPSILLDSINLIKEPKPDTIASHPRIAFRRISAPANLLSSQLNAFIVNNLNAFATLNTSPNSNTNLAYSTLECNQNLDDSSKLVGMLLNQQRCQHVQLVRNKESVENLNVTNRQIFNSNPNLNCLHQIQPSCNKTTHFKRRNSEPVNGRNKTRDGQIHFLWEFLLYLLNDKKYSQYICWLDQKKRIFKLLDSRAVSNLWGLYKGKAGMNYETMARALRYYYNKKLLRKINGRLTYQFMNLNDKQLECN